MSFSIDSVTTLICAKNRAKQGPHLKDAALMSHLKEERSPSVTKHIPLRHLNLSSETNILLQLIVFFKQYVRQVILQANQKAFLLTLDMRNRKVQVTILNCQFPFFSFLNSKQCKCRWKNTLLLAKLLKSQNQIHYCTQSFNPYLSMSFCLFLNLSGIYGCVLKRQKNTLIISLWHLELQLQKLFEYWPAL